MFGLQLSHLIREKTHHTRMLSFSKLFPPLSILLFLQVVLLKAGEILCSCTKVKGEFLRRLACEKSLFIPIWDTNSEGGLVPRMIASIDCPSKCWLLVISALSIDRV